MSEINCINNLDTSRPLSAEWPNERDIQELSSFGLINYDQENSRIEFSIEGFRKFIMLFNHRHMQQCQTIADQDGKIKQQDEELEKLKQNLRASVPMAFIAKRSINLLERNPETGGVAYQQIEDILATWSEAHDGAGNEVIEKMDSAYRMIKDREDEKREREWLMKNKGHQVNFNRGNYEDFSNTVEHHHHRSDLDYDKRNY